MALGAANSKSGLTQRLNGPRFFLQLTLFGRAAEARRLLQLAARHDLVHAQFDPASPADEVAALGMPEEERAIGLTRGVEGRAEVKDGLLLRFGTPLGASGRVFCCFHVLAPLVGLLLLVCADEKKGGRTVV